MSENVINKTMRSGKSHSAQMAKSAKVTDKDRTNTSNMPKLKML
jgi:hypothetical protein